MVERRSHGFVDGAVDRDVVVDIYQDDAVFGLSFLPFVDRQLPVSDEGSLRSRREIPVVTGRIDRLLVAARDVGAVVQHRFRCDRRQPCEPCH